MTLGFIVWFLSSRLWGLVCLFWVLFIANCVTFVYSVRPLRRFELRFKGLGVQGLGKVSGFWG